MFECCSFAPEDFAFCMETDKKCPRLSARGRFFSNKSKQLELVLMKKCNLFQTFDNRFMRSIIAGNFMKNPGAPTIYPRQCFSFYIVTIHLFL
jgi:hypothetical protein